MVKKHKTEDTIKKDKETKERLKKVRGTIQKHIPK